MSTRKQRIRKLLEEALHPQALHIEDESRKHEGHTGAGEGGHYIIHITAEAFDGQSKIARHRLVYEVLKDAFDSHIHALSIKAKAPAEG